MIAKQKEELQTKPLTKMESDDIASTRDIYFKNLIQEYLINLTEHWFKNTKFGQDFSFKKWFKKDKYEFIPFVKMDMFNHTVDKLCDMYQIKGNTISKKDLVQVLESENVYKNVMYEIVDDTEVELLPVNLEIFEMDHVFDKFKHIPEKMDRFDKEETLFKQKDERDDFDSKLFFRKVEVPLAQLFTLSHPEGRKIENVEQVFPKLAKNFQENFQRHPKASADKLILMTIPDMKQEPKGSVHHDEFSKYVEILNKDLADFKVLNISKTEDQDVSLKQRKLLKAGM